MKIQFVRFCDAGISAQETKRKEIIQLACDWLMDNVYMDFNECDVIRDYNSIVIDWKTGYVLVPCETVYKPEYLH